MLADSLEPRVQFATTSDGVRIAYVKVGRGPALLYLQPFGHAQKEWAIPEFRTWYARLADHHTLVRLDPRNFGLSQRDTGPITLETLVQDIDAVVGRLGLEPFDLMAVGGFCPAAMAYAAQRPKQVSRLVLWGAGAKLADWHFPHENLAERGPHDIVDALVEAEGDIGLDLLRMGMFVDSSVPAKAQRDYVRAVARPKDLAEHNLYLREVDADSYLPRVHCPTLVVYPSLEADWPSEPSQRIAATLPAGEFVACDSAAWPFHGPEGLNLKTVESFISTGVPTGSRRAARTTDSWSKLPITRREMEVLAALAAGLTNAEIASELTISRSTVDRHVVHIYSKLGVRNRAQASARYVGATTETT